MTVINPEYELFSCEKYIMDRVEHAAGFKSAKKQLESVGSKKKQLLIRWFARFKGFGFLLLYLNEAFNRRRQKIYIFNDKIVFFDHVNRLIQRKIFEASYSADEIDYRVQDLNCSIFVFLRVYRLLNVFKSFYRARPSSCPALYELCKFWVYYTVYSDWLFKTSLSGVLVIDDYSMRRLALVLAAKDNGLRVGIVKMSDELERPCPFYRYDVLFCWNYRQSMEEDGFWDVVSHLQRPVRTMKKLSFNDNQKLKIGIALNAFFNKPGLINLISILNSEKWADQIIIRFHPSTKPDKYISSIEEYEIEVSEDAPELFFKDLDILICGRTSLIKEALLFGIPVVFDDSLENDMKKESGFVTRGEVFDMTGKQWNLSIINEISEYYQSNKWQEMRKQWILPDPRAISLKKAMEYLLVPDGEQDNGFK